MCSFVAKGVAEPGRTREIYSNICQLLLLLVSVLLHYMMHCFKTFSTILNKREWKYTGLYFDKTRIFSHLSSDTLPLLCVFNILIIIWHKEFLLWSCIFCILWFSYTHKGMPSFRIGIFLLLFFIFFDDVVFAIDLKFITFYAHNSHIWSVCGIWKLGIDLKLVQYSHLRRVPKCFCALRILGDFKRLMMKGMGLLQRRQGHLERIQAWHGGCF